MGCKKCTTNTDFVVMIGDSFSQIFKTFGLPSLLTLRSNVIVGLTSLIIFPLCLLKQLDALKYTSILGLCGTVYCAIFMVIRYLDGSYRAGGKYFSTIASALQPKFGTVTKVRAISIYHLWYLAYAIVNIFSSSRSMHGCLT